MKKQLTDELEGQMSIFDFPEVIPTEMTELSTDDFPCNGCEYDVNNACDYPSTQKDYCVLGSKRNVHHSFPCDDCEKDGFPRKCNTDPVQEFCREKTTTQKEHNKVEYGYRGCDACMWQDTKSGRCQWAESDEHFYHKPVEYTYPSCKGFASFKPSTYKVPRMCGNCEYSNNFCFTSEADNYDNNNVFHQDADHPIEEPNIYCTRWEGSVNRRTEYKDVEEKGFGIGTWNRQHEFDTCDGWMCDSTHRKYLKDVE